MTSIKVYAVDKEVLLNSETSEINLFQGRISNRTDLTEVITLNTFIEIIQGKNERVMNLLTEIENLKNEINKLQDGPKRFNERRN